MRPVAEFRLETLFVKFRFIFAALPLLLAACSTTNAPSPEGGAGEEGAGVKPVAPLAEAPLVVPPLSALPETPARALSGKFRRADWADLPGWQGDDLSRIWPVLVRDCRGLMRPVSGSLSAPARAAPRAWYAVCSAVAQRQEGPVDGEAARQFLQTWLQPWRLDDGAQQASGMVTGYYEPVVQGARQQGGAYQWPLYAPPADLLTVDLGSIYPELAGKRVRAKLAGNRVVPYDTRAAIEASPNKPPVLVWINDPIDNFFLQVQGSGRVQFPDGRVARMAYADHNGQPYVSIGKWLVDQREITPDQASMQNIRDWARRHPERVQEMLNANPAVVFFREERIVDPSLGPRGAYGLPLVAQRAIAVDTRYVPLGAPVFLSTTQPGASTPLRRLVFAQDTGIAIQGAARADFYWGTGDEAGQQAGRMKQRGQMWVLWPKQAGEPSAR